MVKSAAEIWREYLIDGNPLSLQHKPIKADIRELIGLLEKSIGYATVAAATAAAIAAPIISIDVRGHTTEGIGGARYYEVANSGGLIGGQFQSNGGTRRWQIEKSRASNILCHGAATDGSTNSSAAILKAIECCGKAFVPTGVFICSILTLPSFAEIHGEHRWTSILQAPAGANIPVIAGLNAYSLFGGSSYDTNAGCNRAVIRNLTIDGNRANVTSTGDGIAIWGYGTIVKDVTIRNCRGNGLHCEWTNGNLAMEGTFHSIQIDTVGGHGFLSAGPHDADCQNIMVVDAGQNADNSYYGFALLSLGGATYGNGRCYNVHSWHRSGTTNRCAYAIYSEGTNEFVACHAEGARKQMRLGTKDVVTGCRIYAAFGANGSEMLTFAGNNAQVSNCLFDNTGEGNGANPNGSTSANGDVFAVNFGNTSGNIITGCMFLGFKLRTPFHWGTSLGLNVVADCFGYCGAGGATAFGGTGHATDSIDYVQNGTVINYRKPPAYPAYASNAEAVTGGVPLGGLYKLTTTNALTVRV